LPPTKRKEKKTAAPDANADAAQGLQGAAAAAAAVARRAFERAVDVVKLLLEHAPHYATTVGFLLEFMQTELRSGTGGVTVGGGGGPQAPPTLLAQAITFEMAYEKMRMNLITSDAALRTATLRVWLHLLPKIEHTRDASAGYDLFAVNPERVLFEVMLGVEEAPMDAINGKSRLLKLQQLQTAIECNKIPERLKSSLFPFFVGQLRCRFTLPWKQLRECLVAMTKHMPQHIWQGLLAHISISAGQTNFSTLKLREVAPEPAGDLQQEGEEEEEEDEEDDDDEEEEEEEEDIVKARKGKAAKKAVTAPRAAKVDLFVYQYKSTCFTSTKVQILTPEELRRWICSRCRLCTACASGCSTPYGGIRSAERRRYANVLALLVQEYKY
jgi:ferredoxin